MSLSLGENFHITNNFQDNQGSNALKKAKMEDGQARATQQGQKRAALGTITNNPGVRIQPFRAAKQQVGEMNKKNTSCQFRKIQGSDFFSPKAWISIFF